MFDYQMVYLSNLKKKKRLYRLSMIRICFQKVGISRHDYTLRVHDMSAARIACPASARMQLGDVWRLSGKVVM